MSYYIYVVVLSENDSILSSLHDFLSVCVRDCMGGCFTNHSSEPQNHLWWEDLMFIQFVYCKCVYIIIGGIKDNLGVPREGVWAGLSYVKIVFNEGTTCQKVSKEKLWNLTIKVKEFTVQ